MTNRERLIRAWEIFRDSNPYEICNGREFRAIREPEYCMGQMIEDTLELLKEQQPMLVIVTWQNKDCKDGNCPSCGREISDIFHPKCCGYCGQAVKWE